MDSMTSECILGYHFVFNICIETFIEYYGLMTDLLRIGIITFLCGICTYIISYRIATRTRNFIAFLVFFTITHILFRNIIEFHFPIKFSLMERMHDIKIEPVQGELGVIWEKEEKDINIVCTSDSAYKEHNNKTDIGSYYHKTRCDFINDRYCYTEECRIYKSTFITKKETLKVAGIHSYIKKETVFGNCQMTIFNDILCSWDPHISNLNYSKKIDNAQIYLINEEFLVSNPILFHITNIYMRFLFMSLIYFTFYLYKNESVYSFDTIDIIDYDKLEPIRVNIEHYNHYKLEKCIVCVTNKPVIGYICHVTYCMTCYVDNRQLIKNNCAICRTNSYIYDYT